MSLSIRSLAAVLILAGAVPALAGNVVRDPGQYSVRIAVDPSVLPLGLADLPALGPGVYAGTLTVGDEGAHVEVRFQGTEETTGDPVTIQGRFAPSWNGISLDTVRLRGRSVEDVVTDIDPAALTRMKINGVVRVDGFTSQVAAEVGPGPRLMRWTVR
ncbi:MAG TPA: hypothetical protein VKU85_06060 [bacterium]|nr:hypothetical protein [bacterium]